MEFRWAALIALWTCLIGPILGAPSRPASPARKAPSATVSSGVHTPPARPHAPR
jgi:hypothetical protein